MKKIQHIGKIISNEKICSDFYRMRIDAGNILNKCQSGQFIELRVTSSTAPLLRRPFSISRANDCLEILYKVVGAGTKLMTRLKKNSSVDILGPLGRPFSIPAKEIKQVVMIAGGMGVAPFVFLSDILKEKKIELALLFGAKDKEHVFSTKELKNNGCKVLVATEDGSFGVKGFVTELFGKIKFNAKTTFIYTCGPNPMMKAVQAFARENGLKGEASLEGIFGCGIGACMGCVVKTTSGYKTACHDGPVFDLDEIVF